MKFTLFDRNHSVVSEWQRAFQDLKFPSNIAIDFVHDDIRNIVKKLSTKETNILCTAGNSYGIMGGGIDLVIAQMFPGIDAAVQKYIKMFFYGELPVGTAFPVALEVLDTYSITALYYVPTMRAPMRLQNGENVYLATRAVLTTSVVSKGLDALNMFMPGFGGSCGGVPAHVVADKMALAFDRVFNMDTKTYPTTTAEMRAAHREIIL